MGSIVLKILIFQAIVAAVVIFILKVILNRQLEELAIKKFEYLKLDAEEAKLEALTVISSGNVSLSTQKKIAYLATKKCGRPIKLILKKDSTLKGGLIIKLNKTVIDYSLVGRLKEGGVIRSK